MDDTKSSFHAGLTAESVVDAAVELTRRTHLFSWSIRDLSAVLGVTPSSVYHHVGGKDRLCGRVADRVVGMLAVPSPDREWRDWFRELLLGMGPVLMEYPGTAQWLLLHGGSMRAIAPKMDDGLATLTRAGFGDMTPYAYSVLINNAVMTVSAGDDRLRHEEDGPRDHAALMREFGEISDGLSNSREYFRTFVRPFADGGESALRARIAYYRYNVEITLAGVEQQLRELRDS